MKIAEGPRPWTIHAFAIGFVLLALIDLIIALSSIEEELAILQLDIPSIAWNTDLVIVYHSALFSIVLIPVAAIWVFASRIARSIVSVMSLLILIQLSAAIYLTTRDGWIGLYPLLGPSLVLSCVAILFLPTSNRWLRQEDVNPETFA
jgi:hypothetical protein